MTRSIGDGTTVHHNVLNCQKSVLRDITVAACIWLVMSKGDEDSTQQLGIFSTYLASQSFSILRSQPRGWPALSIVSNALGASIVASSVSWF